MRVDVVCIMTHSAADSAHKHGGTSATMQPSTTVNSSGETCTKPLIDTFIRRAFNFGKEATFTSCSCGFARPLGQHEVLVEGTCAANQRRTTRGLRGGAFPIIRQACACEFSVARPVGLLICRRRCIVATGEPAELAHNASRRCGW